MSESDRDEPAGPHQNQPVETAGPPLDEAHAATIFVHGRGATAQSILGMAAEFDQSDVAYLAPQAANNTWYPNSFLSPVETNEPGRSSGLSAVGSILETIEDAGIPTERVLLCGFSQGACLASEYVARNPTRYGGLVALSGGLIGEELDADDYSGSLDGTPVFFGCSDTDPHIPASRVHESAAIFDALGATVTKRLYPGMGHGINEDELDFLRELLDSLVR